MPRPKFGRQNSVVGDEPVDDEEVQPGHWEDASAAYPKGIATPPKPAGTTSAAASKPQEYHSWNEEETLDHAWWCCYCCLTGGLGCTNLTAKPTLATLCVCCTQVCDTQPMLGRDGCMHCTQTCCCCTFLFQLPFRYLSPKCVCCSVPLFGPHKSGLPSDAARTSTGSATADEKERGDEFSFVLYEQYVPCHFCCIGCGGNLGISDIWSTTSKCCCCRYRYDCIVPCSEDEPMDCCVCLLTCFNLLGQCRCPPVAENNPMCAILGCRFKKSRAHGPKGEEAMPEENMRSMRFSVEKLELKTMEGRRASRLSHRAN